MGKSCVSTGRRYPCLVALQGGGHPVEDSPWRHCPDKPDNFHWLPSDRKGSSAFFLLASSEVGFSHRFFLNFFLIPFDSVLLTLSGDGCQGS